jgi:hypothetical protein
MTHAITKPWTTCHIKNFMKLENKLWREILQSYIVYNIFYSSSTPIYAIT